MYNFGSRTRNDTKFFKYLTFNICVVNKKKNEKKDLK